MSERASLAGSKASRATVESVPKSVTAAAAAERTLPASDCPQNPPCTTCTLIRCKSSSPASTCATCTFMPDRCNLSSIMKRSCYPTSPMCAPRCPPPPMMPPSSLCSPRCPPSPRCTLPPRCFRCCEVTSCSPTLYRKSNCDPPICPPPKCDPCLFLKYDPTLSKYEPCVPKLDPCPPKCDPCCPPPPPCCPPPAPVATPPKAVTPPPPSEKGEKTPEVVKTPESVHTPQEEEPCPKSPPPVHRCPSDVEAERPKYFIENITGAQTWQMYGVRIHYTDPESPGTSTVKVGSPFTVKLGIEVKANSCLSADIISAYMWTHMKTMCNPCGTWKDLPLHFQPDQSTVGECGIKRYVYSSTLTPTESDTFRLTFNIKWGNYMVWANNYGDDNMVGVATD